MLKYFKWFFFCNIIFYNPIKTNNKVIKNYENIYINVINSIIFIKLSFIFLLIDLEILKFIIDYKKKTTSSNKRFQEFQKQTQKEKINSQIQSFDGKNILNELNELFKLLYLKEMYDDVLNNPLEKIKITEYADIINQNNLQIQMIEIDINTNQNNILKRNQELYTKNFIKELNDKDEEIKKDNIEKINKLNDQIEVLQKYIQDFSKLFQKIYENLNAEDIVKSTQIKIKNLIQDIRQKMELTNLIPNSYAEQGEDNILNESLLEFVNEFIKNINNQLIEKKAMLEAENIKIQKNLDQRNNPEIIQEKLIDIWKNDTKFNFAEKQQDIKKKIEELQSKKQKLSIEIEQNNHIILTNTFNFIKDEIIIFLTNYQSNFADDYANLNIKKNDNDTNPINTFITTNNINNNILQFRTVNISQNNNKILDIFHEINIKIDLINKCFGDYDQSKIIDNKLRPHINDLNEYDNQLKIIFDKKQKEGQQQLPVEEPQLQEEAEAQEEVPPAQQAVNPMEQNKFQSFLSFAGGAFSKIVTTVAKSTIAQKTKDFITSKIRYYTPITIFNIESITAKNTKIAQKNEQIKQTLDTLYEENQTIQLNIQKQEQDLSNLKRQMKSIEDQFKSDSDIIKYNKDIKNLNIQKNELLLINENLQKKINFFNNINNKKETIEKQIINCLTVIFMKKSITFDVLKKHFSTMEFVNFLPGNTEVNKFRVKFMATLEKIFNELT